MNSKAQDEPAPRLVSMNVAARDLNISERHARKLASTGFLKIVALGRRRLVERGSIDALINRGGTQ
jgi:hypothetical protein